MTSFYLTVAIKLALGLISLVFVINLTGKGNLAPSSALLTKYRTLFLVQSSVVQFIVVPFQSSNIS